MDKQNDSETAFQFQTRGGKFIVIIMYFTIYSVLFLDDKPKIQELYANSQTTMAVENWNMYVIFFVVWASGPNSITCILKRRRLFAMEVRFLTTTLVFLATRSSKDALLAKCW